MPYILAKRIPANQPYPCVESLYFAGADLNQNRYSHYMIEAVSFEKWNDANLQRTTRLNKSWIILPVKPTFQPCI